MTEWRLDGDSLRFALLATLPVFVVFSLFFSLVITGSLCQLLGPASAMWKNSIYYSAIAPDFSRHQNYELPHVAIQMPVYKERLESVIVPTVESVLRALRYYESMGGSASIFVNDDGMQLLEPAMAAARKAFYRLHDIGWCARPPHNTTAGEDFFQRQGHFKKASNMNYCLNFATRVEDEWLRRRNEFCAQKNSHVDRLTVEEERQIYEAARKSVVESDKGRSWAGGDVRLGDIILLIDADTRLPEECLLYGALELHESPEVAILQHQSGILQVAQSTFENGITYFTNLIYTSLRFAVGNGDVAPFVGHNSFIRWSAMQSVARQGDGVTEYWSENHVSEDFDLSLRLQVNDFVVRLATYHEGEFKEGVSLTVHDELRRWKKYAFGCSELVFNPLYKWPVGGPITPLFRCFAVSNIKVTSKVSILAYIGTYYAIASAVPLTVANYCLVGWLNDDVDQFYMTSWKNFVGMTFVFSLISPLGYAMLRHRLGQEPFCRSLWESAVWTPMLVLFFGGISLHLLEAVSCHLLSIKMEWTTTAKEVEENNFRKGLCSTLSQYRTMYILLWSIWGFSLPMNGASHVSRPLCRWPVRSAVTCSSR